MHHCTSNSTPPPTTSRSTSSANATFDASLAYSIPTRRFDTVNGVPESVEFGENKLRPSLNLKFDVFDNAACLASYREPFGVDSDYGTTWSQAHNVVSTMLKV